MAELIPTLLAVAVLVFFGIALYMMSASNYMIAGMSFIGASVTIYFREQHLKKSG